MLAMALDAELKFYADHKDELVQKHPLKYVVIKGDKLLGAYDTAQAAYEAGVAEYGTEPFLTRQVVPTEPIAHAPAIYAGLVALTPH
jgi:hypothetical protein